MREPIFREIAAGELFDIRQGSSRYTRQYVRERTGPYPVYSASTDAAAIYGAIDTHDYDGEVLTWIRSGYAGRVILRNGKFSVNSDAGVLMPRQEHAGMIFLPYFVPVLTRSFSIAAVGRYKSDGASDYTKVSLTNLRKAMVAVPVEPNGRLDIEAQKEIAARYLKVGRVKKDLARLADELGSARIASARMQEPLAAFAVEQIFEVMRGDGTITKAYIRAHPGSYPVYSGSSFRDEVAGHIARFDHEGECLTWAADGYAGPVFHRSGRFCANSHSGILKPKPELADRLYLPFLEHELSTLFQEAAVGRFRPDGSPDYTRVTMSMARKASVTLPVLDDGLPDLERQRKAADRLNDLRKLRDDLRSELHKMIDVDVVIEGLQPASAYLNSASSSSTG